ncbi:Diheme cytochrome c [Magnetospirillum gryphiswaldense MSR-1 v2]|uniref:Diheme cytochrome c n=1 Tax=Magnetospirillum gryphiswaldense (strain DSM 6361 / JCM 21280 / NBRC 15271 / MSR-1) TaxID=431944 RepID=V6F1P9_MAGGM|nr:diheme cytochrome c [Magnetospirillum gryphiswaldense]CDK99369.1 Diheme cytochrome c [Magnetospirillum gryphiswaldense MSR-1 v2]
MTMILRTLLLATLLALPFASAARAGDDWVPPVTDPLVKKECGTCHMAFQPAFLPARSWNKMMDTLADHFGEDASLPADKAAAIRAYLTQNAGDVVGQGRARKYMRHVAGGDAPQRITENPDFIRKHQLPERVWKDPKVVTKSNCPACHVGADRGFYEDD